MKKWKLPILVVGLVVSQVAMPAYAVDVFGGCGQGAADSKVCSAASDEDALSLVKQIINLMLFGLGIAAVILIIHSGLKYVASRGDPANIKSAKDTLLYAIIGLIVAVSAYAIVNFVLGAFK